MTESMTNTNIRGYDSYQMKLGDLMRGERATLGKSLLDVQRDLRIKAAYISAIENCDPTVFQTPGFIAGHVRSYARYLKLDPDVVFAMFCVESDFTGVNVDPKQKKKLAQLAGESAAGGNIRPAAANSNVFPDPLANTRASFAPSNDSIFSQLSGSALISVLVLVALILGIGYGAWVVLQDIQRVEFAPVNENPGLASEMEFATDATELTILETQIVAKNLDRLYRPQELDVPVMIARDGPISTLNPDRIGASMPGGGIVVEPEIVDTVVSGPKVIEDPAQPVSIVASRAAWVRVSQSDGTVLFEKILNAGESFILPVGVAPPLLRAGNAGFVFVTVGGETYGPIGDGTAVVKQISLAEADIRAIYSTVSDRDQLHALENPKVITLNQTNP